MRLTEILTERSVGVAFDRPRHVLIHISQLTRRASKRVVTVEFPPAALTEFADTLAHVIETPQGRAYAGSAMVESARRCRDKLQKTGLILGTEEEEI